MVVGTYRVKESAGVEHHPLSGHTVSGHVAFCVPFPAEEIIGCWTGTIIRDDDGPKLEFVRRLVGHGLDGVQNSTVDTFRRVEAEWPSAAAGAFPGADPGIESGRA